MNAKAKVAPLHRLTNADISDNYRDVSMWLMRKDFTGQFANWVVQQSPYEVPDLQDALLAYANYVSLAFGDESCKEFSYDELAAIVHEDELEKIPEVLALNVPKVSSGLGYIDRYTVPHPDYDFIDLGALARNVFYSMVRSHINWAESV